MISFNFKSGSFSLSRGILPIFFKYFTPSLELFFTSLQNNSFSLLEIESNPAS